MRRKLLTSGFILYILVLLTQPCEDFQAVSLEIKGQGSVAAIYPPIPSESESGPETCSPFCVCGCCGISVVHHGFTTIAMTDRVNPSESLPVPTYKSPSNGSYVDSIWQPPKV